ncbi:hypothetical protein FXB42_11880 [Acetobacterium wieringae]|uniref:Uncharacterized protein n=1 Tax=Acetobacterium wieringae TaxID=52694 RepID=A0A5D0WJI8_9FIRM|nr:hypothetical protein [Acetobacterium wieringae]TYC84462.1 hypothetical protein FXB42_11880 [Acetobacterium wieringae]
MKIKSYGKKALAVVGSMAMIAAFASPTFAAGLDDGADFYIAVDQSTMGGPAIVAPAHVHVNPADYSTTTVLELLNDVKGSVTVHDNWGYVDYMSSSFSDSYDFDNVYDGDYTLPCINANMVSTNQSDGLLKEKEFTGVSGWMMQIDSQTSGTYGGEHGLVQRYDNRTGSD